MVKDKDKKVQEPNKKPEPSRLPADKLLLQFIQANKIVLIADEISSLNADIKDAVYVVLKRPRIRAFYLDQLKDLEKPSPDPNGKDKPKFDLN